MFRFIIFACIIGIYCSCQGTLLLDTKYYQKLFIVPNQYRVKGYIVFNDTTFYRQEIKYGGQIDTNNYVGTYLYDKGQITLLYKKELLRNKDLNMQEILYLRNGQLIKDLYRKKGAASSHITFGTALKSAHHIDSLHTGLPK